MQISLSTTIIPLLLSGVGASLASILDGNNRAKKHVRSRSNPITGANATASASANADADADVEAGRSITAMSASSRALSVAEPEEFDWKQIGQTIIGEAYLDLAGKGLSISDDGSIVAIGAVDNDGESGLVEDDQGHVRVYKYENNTDTWNQIGTDIDGIIAEDQFGWAVSLSGNGLCVAVGVPYHDDALNEDIGRVQVFEYDGIDWVQRGNQIFGEAAQDLSGFSVSMVYDGSMVALGAPQRDATNGERSGYTRIFEWIGTQWLQKGSDIDGEASFDRYGYSVDLSGDGSSIAIGAIFNEGVNGVRSGHVRVHKWDGDEWVQRGSDIDGEYYFDEIGYSVSLSYFGDVVAVGAPVVCDGKGAAHVFYWDGVAWMQRGDQFLGLSFDNLLGTSVSISNDGNRVAIGVPYGNGNATHQKIDSGHCKTYEWTGSDWKEMGSIIYGESTGDVFGTTVAISGDGTHLAIGSPKNGETIGGLYGFVGAVQIFVFRDNTIDVIIPTASPTTSPTTSPTDSPTASPTASPTVRPTVSPTTSPTVSPTGPGPTASPTVSPTMDPTASPTASPTKSPTASPTATPTAGPTAIPTVNPTVSPTASPTASPTVSPTASPTTSPTTRCCMGILGRQCCVADDPYSYDACEWDAALNIVPVRKSVAAGTKCCVHVSDPTHIIQAHDNGNACPAPVTPNPTRAPSPPSPTASPTANPTMAPVANPPGDSCSCTQNGQSCCVPGNDKVYQTCGYALGDAGWFIKAGASQPVAPGTKCCQHPMDPAQIMLYTAGSQCP